MFRNPEIKKYLIFFICITIFGILCGFTINVKAAALAFLICIAFASIFIRDLIKRYKNIKNLADEIDAILHGKEEISFSNYSEGDLSILQNEVIKMTVRLREQADLLKKDKIYLADSMADISHQIRTPLTSINLIMASLINSETSEKTKLHQIREVKKLLDRIDWLISTMLKIAKLDAGTIKFNKSYVEFSDIIKKAVEPLEIIMELKDQTLVSDICGGFIGDLQWTIEAVGNIIKDCTEHMDSGNIYITASENVLYSEIVIRDTGNGIDKEDLPYIFDRFYKGKNSSEQSVGIGLALARMIISRQNGTVRDENHPKGGAVFTITFYKSIV